MQRYLSLVFLLLTASCGPELAKPFGVLSCQAIQGSSGATIICPGQEPVTISNGLPGASGVIALIDPCGDHPGQHDEVVLRLSSTSLVAYFKSGSNEFLSVLALGSNYVTTDAQACHFTVNSDGTVTDQLGGQF